MAIFNLGWFCFKKDFSGKRKKKWFGLPMGVLPWNKGLEQRKWQIGSPFLEILLTCFKNVFQQRYRDVVGHAISIREKLD
jgi:hypothetical protein